MTESGCSSERRPLLRWPTLPRSLKAQRDDQWGLDSVREECLEKGESIGKIQILQQLLGEEASSTESLRERTISELSTLVTDLQERLRSRES